MLQLGLGKRWGQAMMCIPVPLWRSAPGWEGGRQSRRGKLGVLHTSPVLKLDLEKQLGQTLVRCQEALGEELVCLRCTSPYTVSQI